MYFLPGIGLRDTYTRLPTRDSLRTCFSSIVRSASLSGVPLPPGEGLAAKAMLPTRTTQNSREMHILLSISSSPGVEIRKAGKSYGTRWKTSMRYSIVGTQIAWLLAAPSLLLHLE